MQNRVNSSSKTLVAGKLTGKIALVTGGNSGIGFETVVGLAKMGATVVLVARNPAKGEAAVEKARARSGNPDIHLLLADLSRQADIHQLANVFRAQYSRLDVLVNNAAIIPPFRTLTDDRIEMQFAVNHLAPFLLTHLLLDSLNAAPQGRVINVSSAIHYLGGLNFNRLQNPLFYHALYMPIPGWQQYSNTKLMNVIFTRELARRLCAAGSKVTANCLHPGIIGTRLYRNMPVIGLFFRLLTLDSVSGAQTTLFVASSPALNTVSGEYFASSGLSTASPSARNRDDARRLWDISAELTGVDPDYIAPVR